MPAPQLPFVNIFSLLNGGQEGAVKSAIQASSPGDRARAASTIAQGSQRSGANPVAVARAAQQAGADQMARQNAANQSALAAARTADQGQWSTLLGGILNLGGGIAEKFMPGPEDQQQGKQQGGGGFDLGQLLSLLGPAAGMAAGGPAGAAVGGGIGQVVDQALQSFDAQNQAIQRPANPMDTVSTSAPPGAQGTPSGLPVTPFDQPTAPPQPIPQPAAPAASPVEAQTRRLADTITTAARNAGIGSPSPASPYTMGQPPGPAPRTGGTSLSDSRVDELEQLRRRNRGY